MSCFHSLNEVLARLIHLLPSEQTAFQTTAGFVQSPVVQFPLIFVASRTCWNCSACAFVRKLDKAHCLGTWWCFLFPPIGEQKKDEFLCVLSLFPITPWSCYWENWGRKVWWNSKWLERLCVQMWLAAEWGWIVSPSQVMLTNWKPPEL